MTFFTFGKKKPLVLNEQKREEWAQEIAEHEGFVKQIGQFKKELEQKKAKIRQVLEHVEEKDVPERAQHVTTQHAQALRGLVEETLEKISFGGDVTQFPQQIDVSISALERYKEMNTKHLSALKEFAEASLAQLTKAMNDLEDYLLKTVQELEEKGLQSISRIQELSEELTKEIAKKGKYERTLKKYLSDQEENKRKQKKHEDRIVQQRALVREKNAVSALQKIKEIETADYERKAKYERLVFDTKHYILKNGLTLNEASKTLFDNLKKNPDGTLKNAHDKLKVEFEELYDAMKTLEQDDKKNIVGRLRTAAAEVIDDAQKLVNNEQVLHELKKQVIHDIAALNIYEQEQFLLRARQEASDCAEKIHVLTETVNELRCTELEEELQKEAQQFSVIINRQNMPEEE